MGRRPLRNSTKDFDEFHFTVNLSLNHSMQPVSFLDCALQQSCFLLTLDNPEFWVAAVRLLIVNLSCHTSADSSSGALLTFQLTGCHFFHLNCDDPIIHRVKCPFQAEGWRGGKLAGVPCIYPLLSLAWLLYPALPSLKSEWGEDWEVQIYTLYFHMVGESEHGWK